METALNTGHTRKLVDDNIGDILRKVDDGSGLTPEEATMVVAWLSSITDMVDEALIDVAETLWDNYCLRALLIFFFLAGSGWSLFKYWAQ
jgi:hypothetical protein